MTIDGELVVFAIFGLFGTKVIPDFAREITGQRHMTPFDSELSAVLNLLCSGANARSQTH